MDNEETGIEEQIGRYESALRNGEYIYLDVEQVVDMVDYYTQREAYAKAMRLIEYALRIHPGDTELLIELSFINLDMKNIQQAKRVSSMISDAYNCDVILLNAEIALNEGNLDEAERLLDGLNSLDRRSKAVVLDIADLYRTMGYPDNAISWIDSVSDVYAEDVELMKMKADILSDTVDRKDEAVVIYNKILDKDPYDSLCWLSLAKCHYSAGNYKASLEACEFAIAADESNGDAYTMLAHSYLQLDNYDMAGEYFKKAAELGAIDEYMKDAFVGLTRYYSEDYESAAAMFANVVEAGGADRTKNLEPILPDLYLCYAVSLAYTGDFDKAVAVCENLIADDPDDANPYLSLSKIYDMRGDSYMAKMTLEQALEVSDDVYIWATVAERMMEYELYDEAFKVYRSIFMKCPDYPDILLKLALVSLLTGNLEEYCRCNRRSGYRFSDDEAFDIYSEKDGIDDSDSEYEKFKSALELIDKRQREEGEE